MHHSETAAVINKKGGVGKTTSVVNVGAGLSILGKRVLIVDLDPQGHLTGFLGISPDEFDVTIYDVIRGEADIREAIITRPMRARFRSNGDDSTLALSVIPSNSELAEAEMVLANAIDREFLLRNALVSIMDDYDYILFDCPPSLGLISINALAASGKVFIPVQTEHLALRSLEDLIQEIEAVMSKINSELVIGGLFATRFDGRKVLNREVVRTLEEKYGVFLMDTVIRENIALAESPRFGKDIFSYRPNSYGMEDYLNLSLEILGRDASAGSLFSVKRGVISRKEQSPPLPRQNHYWLQRTGDNVLG
ncbi:MAG: AAA family ATPase [Candidatus Latescibacteria bacterium]|nr:AAA family ATPase [bacterium]MBD3422893.1 AAA family ATPase [Candidatus Latescibacterota bacterium]